MWNGIPKSSVRASTDGQGRSCLTVQGEFDFALSLELTEALDIGADGNGAADVDLDLSEVTYMDSTGIRLLIMIRSRVRAAGHVLTISAASEQVYRVLELTNLIDEFAVPKTDNHENGSS